MKSGEDSKEEGDIICQEGGWKVKKILFLIHDLGPGGAEKVLINLVNNLDTTQFEITVLSLFDVGVNRQFLSSSVHYLFSFSKMLPGNSRLMKLLSPVQLHKWLIKENYDIEIAYLEGPCARIISGCPNLNTKLISWIHIEQHGAQAAAASFRNIEEATHCYNRFDQIVCVSETVKQAFINNLHIITPVDVYYNTNESEKIIQLASEPVEDGLILDEEIKLIGVGKLLQSKGFDRIIRIVKRLYEENYPIHLYILGIGPAQEQLETYIRENELLKVVSLMGYQTNPYKYVSKCDLFVCASYAEGFSTATTEALIVGTPVCTVEVSGMNEMLGEHNEYGIITKNNDEALYIGIKELLDNPDMYKHYKKQAEIRGRSFSTRSTIEAVQKMLNNFST